MKWIYRVVRNVPVSLIQEILTDRGQHNWELCSLHTDSPIGYFLVFKKQVINTNTSPE